jgi:hypothetical protein
LRYGKVRGRGRFGLSGLAGAQNDLAHHGLTFVFSRNLF